MLDNVEAAADHPLATASFEVAAGEDAEHAVAVGAGGATVTGALLQANWLEAEMDSLTCPKDPHTEQRAGYRIDH